jgi:hypothetical protein
MELKLNNLLNYNLWLTVCQEKKSESNVFFSGSFEVWNVKIWKDKLTCPNEVGKNGLSIEFKP